MGQRQGNRGGCGVARGCSASPDRLRLLLIVEVFFELVGNSEANNAVDCDLGTTVALCPFPSRFTE